MYKCLRFVLLLTVLLAVYAVVMLAALLPRPLVVVAAIVLIVLGCRSHGALTSHGSARWSTRRELDRAGMLEGSGVILGTVEGKLGMLDATCGLLTEGDHKRAVERFVTASQGKQKPSVVRLTKAVHVAAFAPTGVGKGRSLCLPFILNCPDAMVALDYKGELVRLAAEARRRMGHRVVVIDPFGEVGGTDTLNPLDFIRKEDPNALDECASLAKALVLRPPEERDSHFSDSAEAEILAMTALVVAEGGDDRSLQTIRPLLTNVEKRAASIRLMQESSAWEGHLARRGHALTHAKERELGSVMTTINRNCKWLDSPAVAASTSRSTFDPADLLKGKMSIFLVLPPKYQTSHAAMVRMWIDTLLRAVVRGGLSNRKVHFVLDEAASLGHMDQIDNAVDKYRGYGVRLLFMYQSLGQLKECFPNGQEQTLLSNVTQVFFGINDKITADYVAARLGQTTIWVDGYGGSRSTSQGGDSTKGGSTSYSQSYDHKQHGRNLLDASELMSLDPRIAISFVAGMRPVATCLARYDEGPVLPRPMGRFKATLDTVCMFVAAAGAAAAVSVVAFLK